MKLRWRRAVDGAKASVAGKLLWAFCFLLLLTSTPFVVGDVATIQRMVEQASGADFWYERQLQRELLRFKVALTEAGRPPSAQDKQNILFLLDLSFSRLNNLPRIESNDWHTQGIANLEEVDQIRAELEKIDALVPQMDQDFEAFRATALDYLNLALQQDMHLANRVVERQNVLIGRMQTTVNEFWFKFGFYAAGYALFAIALIVLMLRHMRSERNLRRSNEGLAEMAANLQLAHDEAVRANKAKSNFLANVSHELRTPLNAIVGFNDMLHTELAGPLSPKQHQYVENVRLAARRLLALIDSVLDLSRIEAGKESLREEPLDMVAAVNDALSEMTAEIQASGIRVTVDAEPGLPALYGDPMKIGQVLRNLIANSVKFTDQDGSIAVRLARSPGAGLSVVVVDTGIGIEREALERVFDPFEQADSQRARRHKGAGLGLPLVKRFVDLHQGRIRIDSTLGAGTIVTLEFPPERLVDDRGRRRGIKRHSAAL